MIIKLTIEKNVHRVFKKATEGFTLLALPPRSLLGSRVR